MDQWHEGRRIALVPARSGSKRVKDKNAREFFGHPVMAYSIRPAIESEVFDEVICVTDSNEYAAIAEHYGASVPALRPASTAGDTSPDISWVRWITDQIGCADNDVISIVRPTSPFRRVETFRRAAEAFSNDPLADSLRAIRLCSEHPGKMWRVKGNRMIPLLPLELDGVPWHSNQYSALPAVYVQDASLEFARVGRIRATDSISGHEVVPFVSQDYEGFDINYPEDWILAQVLVETDRARLPRVSSSPLLLS